MSSNYLIESNSSTIHGSEFDYQQHCYRNTRARSSSSASDDPTRKRMTHLTTRLKNAFRISQQPTPSSSSSSPSPSSLSSHATDSVFPSSAPMQVRSISLPSSRQQNYYFPSADQLMPKSRPLSCVFEQSTDVVWTQEESTISTDIENGDVEQQDQDHAKAMELDTEPELETPTCVPGLMIDSACSSTVSEVDSLHSAPMIVDKEEEDEDAFVYEQQTEWINTAKHWYSDYKFPFQSKSASAQDQLPPPKPAKQSHEGILKRPHHDPNMVTSATTVLGKRPMPVNPTMQPSSLSNLPSVLSSSNGSGPFHKKKKRTPVIRFDKMVQVHATYSQQDYNRQSDPDAICTRLNATLAHQIKQELNLYKTTEMSIHEQSKVYTQLFC